MWYGTRWVSGEITTRWHPAHSIKRETRLNTEKPTVSYYCIQKKKKSETLSPMMCLKAGWTSVFSTLWTVWLCMLANNRSFSVRLWGCHILPTGFICLIYIGQFYEAPRVSLGVLKIVESRFSCKQFCTMQGTAESRFNKVRYPAAPPLLGQPCQRTLK